MYKCARKALRNLQVCDVIYSYQSTYKRCPDVSSAVTVLTLELEEPKPFFICFSQKTPTESLCSYCLNTSFPLAFPLGFQCWARQLKEGNFISYLLLKALSQRLLEFLLFPLSLHIVLLQPVNLPLGAFRSFVFLILIKIFSYLSEIGRTWGSRKYSYAFLGLLFVTS